MMPLSHTVTYEDGTRTTCTIDGITEFEKLVDTVYPDWLSVDHSAYNDRGTLAPTSVM